MIIGDDFNKKAKKLLHKIASKGEMDTDVKIDVESICRKMKLDKTEAKNLLEYLEAKSLIKIHTYGGPFLYGEVYLTRRGLKKVEK